MITNDAVIFGLLLVVLAGVFHTVASPHPMWRQFYRFVPALLLCYFLPSLLVASGLVDVSNSQLYFVASRYLLPTALVFLTLSVDFKRILALGPKALVMFFTGTVGIVIGGPIALLLVSWWFPDLTSGQGPDAVWRGMTTVAGSWIGGGANQTAMKEVFGVGDKIFSAMVAVDVVIANIWMACLLLLAERQGVIDARNGADLNAIEALKAAVQRLQVQHQRQPTLESIVKLAALGFGITAFSHWGADFLAPWFVEHFPASSRYSLTSTFFWLVAIATAMGLLVAATPLRRYEGLGASRWGSLFIYILVATIGLKMDLLALANAPLLFVLGAVWMSVHAILMLTVMRLIKAPLFFMAVGSQANVGGAASAPVVASAFSPSLAPVGVLLAVLGYAVGTYAAWLCGQVLRVLSVA